MLAYPTATPLANPLPAAQNKPSVWRTKSLWTQLALTVMATLLLMSFFNRPISKWLILHAA